MSIQEHINFNKMNKVQTVKPKSILEHISMSTLFIKRTQYAPMPKSSILEHIHFHKAKKVNTFEKLVEKVFILDDYHRYLDKVIRDHLATRTPREEQVESIMRMNVMMMNFRFKRNVRMNFLSFEKRQVLRSKRCFSDQVEKMEHICENACMNDEPLFLDELFKDQCIIMVRRYILRILSLEFPLKKENLI